MTKVERILQILISIACMIPLFVVTFITVRYNVFVTDGGSEVVNVAHVPAVLYAVVLVLIVLLLCDRILNRIDSGTFLGVGLFFFAVCGLYLVFNADSFLRADSLFCFQAAGNVNSGDFSDFKAGGYVNVYPFQLGWITIERIMLRFSSNITFFYFCFLVISILTILVLWLISREICRRNDVQNITLMLSLAFLPHLFNTLFVYGNVPGYLLFLTAVYFQIRSLRHDRTVYYVLAALLGVASFVLKNNFEIGLVAMLGIYVLELIRNPRNRKIYTAVALALVLVPASSLVVERCYSSESGTEVSLGSGIPKHAFIAMGMQEGNGRYGWYNDYTLKTYRKEGHDSSRTSAVAEKELKKRVRYFGNHPGYARKFYVNKLVSTWGDSLHESVWNGPLDSCGARMYTDVMKWIYHPDTAVHRRLHYFTKIIEMMVMIFTLVATVGLAFGRRHDTAVIYVMLSIVYFTGGFLFHLMWETKAQYTYQYVSMLIPSAALGIVMCREKVGILTDRMIFRLKNRR